MGVVDKIIGGSGGCGHGAMRQQAAVVAFFSKTQSLPNGRKKNPLPLPIRSLSALSKFPRLPEVNCGFDIVVGAKLRSRLIADTNHRDFDAPGLVSSV